MREWLRSRSTGELIILAVTVTVCMYIMIVTTTLIIDAWFHPSKDLSDAGKQIAALINTLIGLLAGFLAGRIDRSNGNGKDHTVSKDDPDQA